MGKLKKTNKSNTIGLRGIKAVNTSLCPLSEEDSNLTYCGYPIEQLARLSTYEEVSYLLINGELPSHNQLSDWTQKLIDNRYLPEMVENVLNKMPKNTNPMSVLRTAVSLLGNEEPEQKNNEKKSAVRLLGVLPTMLGYWYQNSRGKKVSLDLNEPSTSGYLLHLIKGTTPTAIEKDTLNCSLILYAEHELAASTFAVRVCASTLSDFYSCIVSGIATILGPLNGGANERAMALLDKFNSPPEARKVVLRMLEKKELIMGFGHAVYASADPRSSIIIGTPE